MFEFDEFTHDNYSYIDKNGERRFNLSSETMLSVLRVFFAVKEAQEIVHNLNSYTDIGTYWDACQLQAAVKEFARATEGENIRYEDFAKIFYKDALFQMPEKKKAP